MVGADSYLAEQSVETLLEQAVGREDRGQSLQVLRGDETSWTRVLDLARTGSLFAERRAILVRGAEALKGSDEGVSEYLDDPTPGVTLILVAAKADKRKGAWRRIAESAQVVAAEPLKGWALRKRVAEELRKRKLALDDEATDELLDRVGQDLRRLIGELDKLAAFGEGSRLGAEEVAAVLGRGIARPLYALSDALANRERDLALRLLDEVLEEGETPVYVLGALHRSLRSVRAVRSLRPSTPEQIAVRLQMHPFKARILADAGRRWNDPELRGALAALSKADQAMKNSADPRVALTAAVAEACGAGREASGAPRRGR